MPFCFGASCKVECWLKSLLIGARVKEHSCWGAKEGSACICLFCKKWLADLRVKMNKSSLLGVVSGRHPNRCAFLHFLKSVYQIGSWSLDDSSLHTFFYWVSRNNCTSTPLSLSQQFIYAIICPSDEITLPVSQVRTWVIKFSRFQKLDAVI
jgi:hypothetical protein